MACRGDILPVILFLLLPISCFVTYGIAVKLGHVTAGFPYISDTGTHPPESCVFGVLLGLYAFVSTFSVYVRYSQIANHYSNSGRKGLQRANVVGLICGIIAACGLYLVANFQETSQGTVHLIGAGAAFFGSNVYFWIQTLMTYKMREIPGYKSCIRHFRLFVTLVHLGCCISVGACAMAASRKVNNDNDKFHWGPEDGGFKEHITSTILEWIAALLSTIYFLTFMKEFRRFCFTLPQTIFEVHLESNGLGNGHFKIRGDVKISTISENL